MKYQEMNVDRILCDPEMNVSRQNLTPADCEELAQDIDVNGIQTPPTVIPSQEENYDFEVALGFRRFTAMSVNLGWGVIPVFIKDWTREQARIENVRENIMRSDLTYWETCRGLMMAFPIGTSIGEIQAALSKSNTWVLHRWLVDMPKSILESVEAKLLGPADIGIIIQQKNKQEKIRAASKLLAGKAAGETIRDMQRTLTGRKNNRSKKQVQAVMTKCMEMGKEDAVHAMRFAIGEISDTLLYELLEKSA